MENKKNYKPVIILEDMTKRRGSPDWVALILLAFGLGAVYNSNELGFYFIILGLIKYFWTLKNG